MSSDYSVAIRFDDDCNINPISILYSSPSEFIGIRLRANFVSLFSGVGAIGDPFCGHVDGD